MAAINPRVGSRSVKVTAYVSTKNEHFSSLSAPLKYVILIFDSKEPLLGALLVESWILKTRPLLAELELIKDRYLNLVFLQIVSKTLVKFNINLKSYFLQN